jgi:hypothetical protein
MIALVVRAEFRLPASIDEGEKSPANFPVARRFSEEQY